MRNLLIGTVAAFVLSSPGWAQELVPGTATGQLVVGEQTFPLAYSYVLAEDDVENNRSNGPQKSISILLTDVPVAGKDRHDYFKLAVAAREKQLHAVQLKYDPKTKSLYNVTVFAIRPGAKEQPQNISLSGAGASYPLESFTIAGGIASGSARMAKPGEILSFEAADEKAPPRTYTYSATFRATVENPPPVTAILTGSAAKASPQVALATRFFAASHAGNIAEVRKMTLVNPEFETMIQAQGVKKVKEMLKMFSPAPAEFAKIAKKVIVRGDRAVVIAGNTKAETGELRLKVVLVNGKWVVSQ